GLDPPADLLHGLDGAGRAGDQEDHGELATEDRHAAVFDAGARLADQRRQLIDEPGPIGPYGREHHVASVTVHRQGTLPKRRAARARTPAWPGRRPPG